MKKNNLTRRWTKLGAIAFLLYTITACTSLSSVAAWEKGKLARNDMKFDHDRLDTQFVNHIYFSKEAASGGGTVGSGGCGCN
jgi:hypothetical protein